MTPEATNVNEPNSTNLIVASNGIKKRPTPIKTIANIAKMSDIMYFSSILMLAIQ